MAKNRFKILIVEDESHIRTFVRAMLEAEDYQVLCAADCASGTPGSGGVSSAFPLPAGWSSAMPTACRA